MYHKVDFIHLSGHCHHIQNTWLHVNRIILKEWRLLPEILICILFALIFSGYNILVIGHKFVIQYCADVRYYKWVASFNFVEQQFSQISLLSWSTKLNAHWSRIHDNRWHCKDYCLWFLHIIKTVNFLNSTKVDVHKNKEWKREGQKKREKDRKRERQRYIDFPIIEYHYLYTIANDKWSSLHVVIV